MSDFEPQFPPAPPQPAGFGAPPPPAPFAAPGLPVPPPAPGWSGPPMAGGYPLPPAQTKGPRPKVTAGSIALIAGAVLLVVGSFLNWAEVDLGDFGSTSFNGFASDGGTKDGPVFVFFALVLGGFGIAMLAARKVLAVSILSVVFAVLAVLAAVADLKDVSDLESDLGGFGGFEVQVGPGLWVVLLGALVALGGGIATLAFRRKP